MFCTKCGTQLNENEQCPKCTPVQNPVVDAGIVAPVITSSQVKSAWFAPVALLVSTIGGGIISAIFNVIYTIFDNIFGGYNYWFSQLTSALSTLIVAALTLGAIWIFFGMAFKTVSEKEKKSYMLIMLLPLALLWLRSIINSILFSLMSMFEIYNGFLSGLISFVISVAMIVLSYFLTQKAITFVESSK